jgi:hypothetical protein
MDFREQLSGVLSGVSKRGEKWLAERTEGGEEKDGVNASSLSSLEGWRSGREPHEK